MANSTAETPRLSWRSGAAAGDARAGDELVVMARSLIEYGSLRNAAVAMMQALAAGHVGEVEAEQRHVDRPLIHQPHHHDVARAAGLVAEIWS